MSEPALRRRGQGRDDHAESARQAQRVHARHDRRVGEGAQRRADRRQCQRHRGDGLRPRVLLGRRRRPHAGWRAQRARRQEHPLGRRSSRAQDARDGGQAGHRDGQRSRGRRRHGHVRHVRHARGRRVGPVLHRLRPRRPRAGRRRHLLPAASGRRRQGARAPVDRRLHRGARRPIASGIVQRAWCRTRS